MYFKEASQYYKEMTSTITDLDTSKESLIYKALMPTSYVMSYQSMMLDEIVKQVFAKTALENGYGKFLERRCLEQGIERKQATIATSDSFKVIGVKGSTLPKGAIVGTSFGITYTTDSATTLNDSGIGYCIITATGQGSKYNCSVGEVCVLSVKYVGILSVINEKEITNGYDEESNQALYDRYLIKIQTPATSGNKYHYKNWALEVTGVGSAEVYPLWAGNGTVKVVITNSNKRAASTDLVQAVYDHIEEERPIGATVTVVSVTEKAINVTANVQISSAATLNDVQGRFITVLEDCFKSTFNSNNVSIMKIGSLLINIDGVLDVDYSSIKLNNVASNVTLGNDEIAVLGTVNLGVM